MYFTKNTWDCPLFPTQNSSWGVFIVGFCFQWHSNSITKPVKMSPALTDPCWTPLRGLSQPQGYWAVSVLQGCCWQVAAGWRIRGKAATLLLIYHQANKLSLIRDKARCHINPFKLLSWQSYYLFTVLQLIDCSGCSSLGLSKLNASSGTPLYGVSIQCKLLILYLGHYWFININSEKCYRVCSSVRMSHFTMKAAIG